MMKADGAYSPCCKYAHDITQNGNTLNALDHSLEDAWNADSLKALRREFLEGKKPAGCRTCWQEEAAGVQSMRLESFHKIAEEPLSEPAQPLRLELYPSNLCNLKCRICGPYNSSRWISEARETLGITEGVHNNLTPANMDLFRDWLPNLKELNIVGGEPLLLKEYKQLLDLAIEGGYSERITLFTNTNGTIYSDELVRLLQHFEKVYLTFSIDDIGQRFEYQRKGAKWQPVVDNIREYAKHGGFWGQDRIEYKISVTISNFNIFYLDEFFRWLSGTFPRMRVVVNLLTHPAVFCVRTLPTEVKDAVAKKMEAIPAMEFDWGPDTEDEKLRIVNTIGNYLYEGSFLPDWFVQLNLSGFFDKIRRGDGYRKEKFEDVFPEFWQAISKYERLDFRNDFHRSVLEKAGSVPGVAEGDNRGVSRAAIVDFAMVSKTFLQKHGADAFIQLYLATISQVVSALDEVNPGERRSFVEKVNDVSRMALQQGDRDKLAYHLVQADPIDVIRGLYELTVATFRQRIQRLTEDSPSPRV
jgi:MoaA/NifB/PqqE/SkfB family radical SAM enzyme